MLTRGAIRSCAAPQCERAASSAAAWLAVLRRSLCCCWLLLSLAPRWPYPALLPPALQRWRMAALFGAPAPLVAQPRAGARGCAVGRWLLAVLWFETQPPARDRWLLGLALLRLALPQLAMAGGQYRLFLDARPHGHACRACSSPISRRLLAYVLIVLQGPYRAFDARYMRRRARSRAAPCALWLGSSCRCSRRRC